MPTAPDNGLLILHGNRLEDLAETVLAWVAAHPLAPLEEEIFLVQSNGVAEWLKMAIAAAQGICAATRVELPARFIWRAYRAVLGRAAVPAVSALDKLPLTWRLMQLLPELAARPGFEPVAGFLGDGDAARRLQLARRLADLLDQYQVYRSDWLQDWAAGHDRLRNAKGEAPPVPPGQQWQPALWRAALQGLTPAQQGGTRALLHARFLQALSSGAAQPQLPRRIVLFGSNHIPQQTLEALAALGAHCQVLMAVPNPCRYHWADIIDGRELLRAQQRRQPLRGGQDLSLLPLQDLHAHGHPLLAAWGRQGRDFIRQLDAYDDLRLARQRFALPRVDLFDEGPGDSLLTQVQARIRDLVPLAEHPPVALAADDRSIVFHVAHSAQRELEILHDQLLQLLAHPPGGRALNPRDIVVMVPDIERFAPAIRSVFGQHPRGSARHIPWGIADQKGRGQQPLLVTLEWLLRAPQQRFGLSELHDLLDVPALARRFGLAAEDLPTLVAWMAGAGIRWGLNADQRSSLGLGACGDANSGAFGLHRMLLGYATGAPVGGEGFADIEPYAEVAGLSAGLAGVLADLLRVLQAWWRDAAMARTPADWVERLRALLADVFAATDEDNRNLLAALDQSLGAWLQACEAADFSAAVDLAVAREAWLEGLDEPGLTGRFKAGGVTFCTLLPLRAIPFEVLCLLGMNDGDYPRRGSHSDFDLMALPGQARPGDRSRRHDDRQLMLDALLSARRVLYISWAGRSPRDNQVQPPSVLVSQLQDYLLAGWGPDVIKQRSTEHPLQPFSRRYFEPGAAAQGLVTYASEWRAAHVAPAAAAAAAPAGALRPARIDLAGLAGFLRNPVKDFFRHRLQVQFDRADDEVGDDEAFASAGLDRWALMDEALRETLKLLDTAAPGPLLRAQVARLARAGRLPLAGPGRREADELLNTLEPMLVHWQGLLAAHLQACEPLALHLQHPDDPGLVLDDVLTGLRRADAGPVWLELQPGRLADKSGKTPRADKLLPAWLRGLAAAASGHALNGILVGADVVVSVSPPDAEESPAILFDLMQAWREGLQGDEPLPTALRTGLAWLGDPSRARAVYEGGDFAGPPGEGREACLARLYPDFSALAQQPAFESSTQRLYAAYRVWLGDCVALQPLPGQAAGEGGDD